MRDFLNGRFPTSTAAFLLFSLVLQAVSISASEKPERFWLARRYDGNRVLVNFDPVKFDGTLPSNSPKLPEPVTRDFFALVQLSQDWDRLVRCWSKRRPDGSCEMRCYPLRTTTPAYGAQIQIREGFFAIPVPRTVERVSQFYGVYNSGAA